MTHNKPFFSSESASMVCARGEYENNTAKGLTSSYDRKAVSWGQSGEEVLDFTMNMRNIGGGRIRTDTSRDNSLGKSNILNNSNTTKNSQKSEFFKTKLKNYISKNRESSSSSSKH